MPEKEFGKLSLSQLKQLHEMLLQLQELRKGFEAAAKLDEKGFIADLPLGFRWAEIYSYPFLDHLKRFLCFSGADVVIEQAKQQGDPQQFILDELPKFQEKIRESDKTSLTGEQNLFGIAFSLFKSLDAMLLYGKSLSRLLLETVQGDFDSLLKAVSVDHTIVGNSVVTSLLTFAEMEDDKKFFIQLSNAMSKRPRKPKSEYGALRYLLATLDEIGELEKLSHEERYELFCVNLKVYDPEGNKDDPAEGLKKFIQRWKKDQGTSVSDFMSSTSE